MKNYYKVLALIIVLIYPIIMIGFVAGNYDTSYNGFAIDSKGYVYMGCEKEIKVFKNNLYCYSISPRTSRGYEFTIFNEKILVEVSQSVFVLDTKGNDVEYSEDLTNVSIHSVRPNKKVFLTDNNVYKMKKTLGRTRIVDNKNDVVFEMPLRDYSAKIILSFSSICFGGAVILLIIINHRKVSVGNRTRGRFSD